MKIAIFSDVHGNLPALELALHDAGKADKYFFLGDVVNYGPWSNECVQLIAGIKNSIKILGNHETYFIKRKCNSNNTLVNVFFNECIKNFKEFEEIKSYKTEVSFEGITFVHTLNGEYIYKDSNIKFSKNYFVGHSHQQFQLKNEKNWIINPGSVGQNRQAINKINYALFNTETHELDFKSINYDSNKIINEMKNRNYPQSCLDYYISKIK